MILRLGRVMKGLGEFMGALDQHRKENNHVQLSSRVKYKELVQLINTIIFLRNIWTSEKGEPSSNSALGNLFFHAQNFGCFMPSKKFWQRISTRNFRHYSVVLSRNEALKTGSLGILVKSSRKSRGLKSNQQIHIGCSARFLVAS